MSIETRFDIPLVAGLALREKQIQQNYRPIIAVHKWFARRPGTLFRALVLSEFGDAPLADIYFTANDFPGRKIADPFMGGGTPLIEANRVGCDITGFDINRWQRGSSARKSSGSNRPDARVIRPRVRYHQRLCLLASTSIIPFPKNQPSRGSNRNGWRAGRLRAFTGSIAPARVPTSTR